MHRPGPALVAGVERREQIHDLRTADLADHDAIGTHPQCLPDQVTHRHLADAFDIGAARDQPDQVRMLRCQLGGVFDADDPLRGVDGAEQRGQHGGLTGAGTAGNQEGQPRRDDVGDERDGGRRDGPGADEAGQVLRRGPQDPQREAGARGGDRRQHGMQPHGQATADTAEVAIDPRLRIIEPPPGRQREPLRQALHGILVRESDGAAAQPVSVVDPHLVRCADQHVGRTRCPQQRFQNSGTGQFGLQ